MRTFSTDMEYRDRPHADLVTPLLSDAGSRAIKELIVNPGSLLKVSLPQCAAEVEVVIGQIDRIVAEVMMAGEEEDLGVHLETTATTNTLEVKQTGEKHSSAFKVKAWIPERFCSVEVRDQTHYSDVGPSTSVCVLGAYTRATQEPT